MIEQHLERIESNLSSCSYKHQLAFSAACCERSLPFYELFAERIGWGDPRLLRSALDAVWQTLEDSGVEKRKMKLLRKGVEAVTPDLDDFAGELAAAAQEAAFALMITLRQTIRPDARLSRQVASYLRDTVDMYVITVRALNPNDPQIEGKIASDPLMKDELSKQAKDLQLLAGTPRLTPPFLHEFRREAKNGGGLPTQLLVQVDSSR